jgi:hypothetical protein
MKEETDPILTVQDLEERLSRPTESDAEALSSIDGDLLVLGAGGKMGPSLARLARRAADQAGVRKRIIAVARFSDKNLAAQLVSSERPRPSTSPGP